MKLIFLILSLFALQVFSTASLPFRYLPPPELDDPTRNTVMRLSDLQKLPQGCFNLRHQLLCPSDRENCPFPTNNCYCKDGKTSCLPGAMILGQHKAGTSALSSALSPHEHLLLLRETHMFTAHATSWVKTEVSTTKLMVDVSPSYLNYGTHLPEIIHHYNPFMKFIIILRHPIERLISSIFYYSRCRWYGMKEKADLHDLHKLLLIQIERLKRCTARVPPPNTTLLPGVLWPPNKPYYTAPGLIYCLQEEQYGFGECEGRLETVYHHLSDSLYSAALIRWLSVFPSENFFISTITSPTILPDIQQFLGVPLQPDLKLVLERPPAAKPNIHTLEINPHERELLPETITALRAFFQPFVCETRDIWETAPIWDFDCGQ